MTKPGVTNILTKKISKKSTMSNRKRTTNVTVAGSKIHAVNAWSSLGRAERDAYAFNIPAPTITRSTVSIIAKKVGLRSVSGQKMIEMWRILVHGT